MRSLVAVPICVATLLLSASVVSAETVERVLKVTFVSADLVYLNGGRAEGLFVGARPVVFRDDQKVAELEVLHLAEHSSACRIPEPAVGLSVGDVVKLNVELPAVTDTSGRSPQPSTETSVESQRKDQTDTRPANEPTIRPEASGSVAVMYSNWDDHSDAGLDFGQGRVDIDLRVEPLWTPGLSFALRTSGRQDRRAIPRDGSRESSWESRIGTFALEYKPEGSRAGMSMGRINPARVGAIGRLDGGSVEYRVSQFARIGVFGGANSQWQYAENRPNLQTYGAYAGYRRGSARDFLLDQTFSVVGQYHGGTASREALFAQGRMARNGRWNLSHSVELDVNRGWRKSESNQSISLSTIYAQGRINLTRNLTATLSYDTRKSYRTYETRDIADSIFDDRVRQGVRAQFDLALPEGVFLSAGAGLRSVAGEPDRTTSYSGAVRKQGLFNPKSSFSVQGVRFVSDATSGYNLNASLGQGVGQRDWISLGAGLYSYTLAGSSDARLNRRADLTVRVGVTQALALNALGQLSGGDDTRGHRLEAGMSLQF